MQSRNDAIRTQRLAGYGFIAGLALLLGLMATGIVEFGGNEARSFTVEFDIGTEIESDQAAKLDAALAHMAEHPDRVVVITGHTGTAGDLEANQNLSMARAEAVRDRLVETGAEPGRLIVLGAGGELPPERAEGVSDAAFSRQLPRAVITITEERLLVAPGS